MKSIYIFFAASVITLFLWLYRPLWINFFSLSAQQNIVPENLSPEFDPSASEAVFNNQRLKIPSDVYQKRISEVVAVLGEISEPKRIEIDLTNQRLYAFEGERQIYNFLISSGKWGWTPTGKFRIWIKLRSTKMEGGKKELGTYYYLPNVPFVMYFYNRDIPKWKGFGIHGTYWHNNFGHPMSHGCINMRTEEAEKLYYWANPDLRGKGSIFASHDNPGTEITIYGKTPIQ